MSKGTLNVVYCNRKNSLPEYRKLFAALLEIPDESFRKRVIDAINGTQKCSVCDNCYGSSRIDVSTQTVFEEQPFTNTSGAFKNVDIETVGLGTQQIRRRKRKRTYPKVVKTSQISENTAYLLQGENPHKQIAPPVRKLMRNDSLDAAVSHYLETGGLDLETHTCCPKGDEYILEQTKIAWETRSQYNQAGLLPLHVAIVENELTSLKKQIFIWKFLKVNIADVVTEDGLNPIQLAIKENCFKKIIQELLNEYKQVNDLDSENNTIIHLAVSHLQSDDAHQQRQLLETLELLLYKIDLNTLLQYNDDGLTAMQIAVKKNEYLMIEKMLDVIDKRLNLCSSPSRSEAVKGKAQFTKYYCERCNDFEGIARHDIKNNILNARDMKRGCTALFFAMDLGYEHIIYLLMAHMCNPNVQNLAGADAKTYYADIGRNNPTITGILENLSAAWNSYSC